MKKWREREEDLENQLSRGALWAVTYGDIMSYLMIFFLILFAFLASGKGNKRNLESSLTSIEQVFGKIPTREELDKRNIKEQEQTAISEMKKTAEAVPMVKLLESERKAKLILEAPVLFDLGRAELKPEAIPVLKSILEPLRKLPNEVIVEGHTDNVRFVSKRKPSSNWELSMERAYSVVRFLEDNGISAKRLSGLGYGENRPVESNDTAEGRAKNRRIEITLIKSDE